MDKKKFSAKVIAAAIAIVAITISCPGQAHAQKFQAVGNANPNHQAPPHKRGEVVVTFDTMPAKMSFDLPCLARMITENGIQYINGWSEGYIEGIAEGQSYEAMNDTNNVYTRYWIESQNDARIVVRHRCALVNNGRIAHAKAKKVAPYGPGDWTDEWYVFHPDGTHIRKVRVYTHTAANSQSHVAPVKPPKYVHELEGMYLWPGHAPGKLVEDHLEKNGIAFLKKPDGKTIKVPYDKLSPADQQFLNDWKKRK